MEYAEVVSYNTNLFALCPSQTIFTNYNASETAKCLDIEAEMIKKQICVTNKCDLVRSKTQLVQRETHLTHIKAQTS